VMWGVEAFGLPIHDNWWQTETGGIMMANFAAMDIKPGSMGKPLPGIEAAIVRKGADGGVETVPDGEEGELALKPGWPSMFRGYLNQEERYRKCFAGGYYLTGDLARRDADGYFWFVGRADDVIKSAGHLIGPFEVESALLEHPAVAEAGVIGKPDPVAGEVVKAFVALKGGFEPGDALRRELLALARTRLGAVVAPKEIAFLGSSQGSKAAVAAARHGVLAPFMKPGHAAIGSINSPMQCMMKEICAQCLQPHVDPATGKRSYVFSCFNQDQPLDLVDFQGLDARLRQNSVQEKLTTQWIARVRRAAAERSAR